MTMRAIAIVLGAIFMGLMPARSSDAGELTFGCCGRPACGKVCRLVCETEMLTVTCYGCECDEICIPGPSRPGCKHCSTTCCGGPSDTCCPGQMPKCEFCWRDWCACGCAKPRTVKKLTKYEAQREICSYHWEVVDGGCCGCGCAGDCSCVYKAAPPEARMGDVFALSADERVQLAVKIAPPPDNAPLVTPASATEPAASPSGEHAGDEAKATKWQKLMGLLRLPGQSR